MARPARAENYLRVRRWLDQELTRDARYSIAVWGPTSVVGFALVGAFTAGPLEPVVVPLFWILVMPPWTGWMAFVAWRASRLTRAAVIKGDREYDQHGKYLLPPEYARLESVAAANRRERRRMRMRDRAGR